MILFATLSQRLKAIPQCLGVLALAGALSIPLMAAELEGTPVPLDSSGPVAPQQPGAPAPDQPPEAPASDEQLPEWQIEHNQQMREMEREMRDHERQMREHESWQRELDKGLEEAFGKHEFDAGDFSLALLIPILAVIFIFGGPIFLVCFLVIQHYRAKARRQQDLNANIDKLLAAGRDIPVELLRGDEPQAATDTGDLASGIRTLFLGVGLLIFLTVLLGFDIGAVGFILIALGSARILIWYLNKPKAGVANKQQAGQQD